MFILFFFILFKFIFIKFLFFFLFISFYLISYNFIYIPFYFPSFYFNLNNRYRFAYILLFKGSLVRNFRSYEQLDSLVKW